jgi:II/X family phage/plasmid replication protein
MVDWLSVAIPYLHPIPIQDGVIYSASYDEDGVQEREYLLRKRKRLEGSAFSGIAVRSSPARDESGSFTEIQISGNFVKYFQGHNLWGTSDIHGLVCDMVREVISRLSLPFDAHQMQAVQAGNYTVSRLDLNTMFDCGTLQNAASMIRVISNYSLPNRKGSMDKETTCYHGSCTSRYWYMKHYVKYLEFKKNGALDALENAPEMLSWVMPMLRREFCIKDKELNRHGWNKGTIYKENPHMGEVIYGYFSEKVIETLNHEVSDNVTEHDTSELSGSVKASYLCWRNGENLAEQLPARTFYRHRSEILKKLGVDIKVTRSKKDTANVTPLVRTITLKPATLPEWALSSGLFYQPKPFPDEVA